jgi:hypothetical protein
MASVFVNSRGNAHKGSGGQSIAFPDVCKTPIPPAGPVPIPYPNIGMSSDTDKGPKKVKTDKKMPMAKGAKYKMTSGDEAGSAQGVVSNKIKGEAEFLLYSFDVKFEKKNVCRMGDSMFHNKKNAVM